MCPVYVGQQHHLPTQGGHHEAGLCTHWPHQVHQHVLGSRHTEAQRVRIDGEVEGVAGTVFVALVIILESQSVAIELKVEESSTVLVVLVIIIRVTNGRH